MFGKKYGDHVRIVSEASIGSNFRRIKALTGRGALNDYDTERRLLEELAALLGTRPQDAPGALRKDLGSLAARPSKRSAAFARPSYTTAPSSSQPPRSRRRRPGRH
ncbi:hypothetical protein ABZW02_29715 [Streptomyces sp. NPDC005180]|uniref:hypothetical protein n=1 Tax=Streptomyces sp. NPDC005180 TaxID=3156868 RepID=UPI0033B5AEEE